MFVPTGSLIPFGGGAATAGRIMNYTWFRCNQMALNAIPHLTRGGSNVASPAATSGKAENKEPAMELSDKTSDLKLLFQPVS